MGLLGTRMRGECARYYVIGMLEVGGRSYVWYAASREVLCQVIYVMN